MLAENKHIHALVTFNMHSIPDFYNPSRIKKENGNNFGSKGTMLCTFVLFSDHSVRREEASRALQRHLFMTLLARLLIPKQKTFHSAVKGIFRGRESFS